MTKENIIVQFAHLNSSLAAMRELLIESGAINEQRFNEVNKQFLQTGKESIVKVYNEDDSVSIPKLIELLENQIQSI